MGTLHCESELSPPSVQQRCFAQLQSNIDTIEVLELSKELELEAAMKVLERYLHCSMSLKSGCLLHVDLSVLFSPDCPQGISPRFSPLLGISLAFVGNLLD